MCMTPYLINGQIVYINEIEQLREYVSDEIWEIINELFQCQLTRYETIRDINHELETDIDDMKTALKDIDGLITDYTREIRGLQRLRKDGIIKRLETLQTVANEGL